MTAPRVIGKPRPGFFKMRLVKGGPYVGAAIFLPCPFVPVRDDTHPDDWFLPLDRPRHLIALIDGKDADTWPVWTSGVEIDAAEYEFLIAASKWDRNHKPDAPAANPRRAMNLNEMGSLF